MTTSRQMWIDEGSRSVCINEQNGHYWANLYVNYRQTITAVRRTFKSEAERRASMRGRKAVEFVVEAIQQD